MLLNSAAYTKHEEIELCILVHTYMYTCTYLILRFLRLVFSPRAFRMIGLLFGGVVAHGPLQLFQSALV